MSTAPALSIALDRVHYLGERLSKNIRETPDGFLICENVVIARTGFQTYQVSELTDPEGILAGSDYSPSDRLEVWRDPKEVFSRDTIASFEGKPLTITHPDKLLNPDNVTQHIVGHIQNVRKGTEALDSGDWPLLADLVVQAEEAIQAIEDGQREVSCGYAYKLAREGYRYEERNIRGNHLAIVSRARAGEEARINDSAIPEESDKEPPVSDKKNPVKNWLKHLLGLGLKEYAKDAAPEDLADAMEEVAAKTAGEDGEEDIDKKVSDAVAEGLKKAKDAEKEEEAEDANHQEEAENKLVLKKGDRQAPAFDDAHRQRLHDALDRAMNDAAEKMETEDAAEEEEVEKDAVEEEEETKDADLDELKGLLNQYLGEEEKEETHKDAAPCPECGKMGDACTCDSEEMEEDAAPEEEKSEEEDAAEEEQEDAVGEEEQEDAAEEEEAEDSEIVREEPVIAKEKRQAPAFDAASTLKLLRGFRPLVARAKDKRLQAGFDAMYRAARVAAKGSGGKGNHADFRKAASHAKDANSVDSISPAEKQALEYEKKMKEAMESSRKRTLGSRAR